MTYRIVHSDGSVEELDQTAYDARFPAPDLDGRRAAKRADVGYRLQAVLAGGYRHDFGSPHGLKILQTRDVVDRTNWLTSQAAYQAQVAAGNGGASGAAFRTADNVVITVTFDVGLGVLLAMAAWGAANYQNAWSLKDSIDAAQDSAALDAVDIEAGWQV